jgi:hypothetical protein
LALVAQTAAFVYIYARIPQIVEMTLSFHATAAADTSGDSDSEVTVARSLELPIARSPNKDSTTPIYSPNL